MEWTGARHSTDQQQAHIPALLPGELICSEHTPAPPLPGPLNVSLFLKPKQTLVFHKVSQQHPRDQAGVTLFLSVSVYPKSAFNAACKTQGRNTQVSTWEQKKPQWLLQEYGRNWTKILKSQAILKISALSWPQSNSNFHRHSRAAQFMANCFPSPRNKPKPSFHPLPQHFRSAGDLYNHTTSPFLGNSG